MHPPLRRWHVLTSSSVVALSIASSLIGLLLPDVYTRAPAVLARTQAEDLVILLIAVPILMGSLWVSLRGSIRGRMVWLGTMAFMTYLWAGRALSFEFTVFFLGNILLLTLSLLTLIGGFTTINARLLRRQFDDQMSVRLYTGVLVVIAGGLAALWLSDIVPATLTGTTPGIVEEFGPTGITTVAIDLGIVVPACVLSAYLLWTDRPWGYVYTGVILVFGTVLAPALTVITAIDVLQGTVTSPGLILGTIVPPIIAAALAIRFILHIPKPH